MSSAASAQPDPFTDYEAMKSGQAPSPNIVPLPAPQPILPPEPTIKTAPWNWSLGGRTSFSYTGVSNEVLDGSDQSNTTLFFRLTPTVGVTVYERVLVTASFGLLGKNLTREDGNNTAEFDALLEFTGHYMFPITKKLALLPGLGLGTYFGESDRAFKLPDGRVVDESTSTFGVAMSIYMTMGYQFSERFELRTGLALYGLIQTEHIESADQNLLATAAHVGLPFEIHYHF